MKSAPLPHAESERLAALGAYDVLDTPPEAFFDQITTLAAEICQTPIALVSLVDGERQWFKSRVGLGATETPRELAFCAHAILEPQNVMIVPDATADGRFSDNPLVLHDPAIRFYAGAPIVDDAGHALGTLCVIDHEPRTLTPPQQRALTALRDAVTSHLQLRRVTRALGASLADREHAGRVLAAQQAVLRVLVESPSTRAAGASLAEAFGSALALAAAGLWLADPARPQELVCAGAWVADPAAGPFLEATYAIRFAMGEGLPGRVFESGEATIIHDTAKDANFPRAPVAQACGLRAAFAIPIRGETGVIGALEVFSGADTIAADLIAAVDSLGRQIGLALEREAAQDAVARGAAELRATIDSALDCIVTIDADGIVTDYNPAAERTFGWPREAAIGRPLADLMVPSSLRQAHWDGMRRYLQTGEAHILGRRLEVPAVRADGSEIHVELTVLRLPGPGAPRFTAFMRDITEGRRAQEAMAQARRAAEEANRAKSEFLAVISHEIRTPMNAIIGMTDLALEGAATADQRELLTTVQSNAEHLLGIINEILDHSKLEAGQMDLSPTPCDVGEVAEGVVEGLAARAADKGLTLTCDVDPALPAPLLADRHRLRQVLMNLVGNAVKFTTTGSVDVRVAVDRTAADTADVHISVRDTGPGIPAEALERVFEQFYQVDSTSTRAAGGTGLGLSISHAIIGLMGGKIWAESELGRGSVFHATIPVLRATTESAQEVHPPLTGVRALLVAPDGAERAAVLHAFEHLGMNAVAAGDIREADRLAASQPGFDLVLLDEDLSDGEAAHVAGERAPDDQTRVVVLGNPRTGGPALQAHTHRIGRPVTRRRLRDVVERLLGTSQPAEAPSAPASGSEGIRVLVVEDNRDNRRYAARLLERAGHAVEFAENGRDGVERVRAGRYHLILADVEMPEMDGFAFARAVRELESEVGDDPTPIVALSAHAVRGFREQCLAAGMQDHLAKPVKAGALTAAVLRHADRRPVVLVADDAAANRDLVRRFLAKHPYRLVFARNGEEALAQFRRGQVSLVLLDMNMPGLDGYQTAQAIRAIPGGEAVPIVAVTGFDGPAEEARCRASGCSAYLAKPVRREELLEALERGLGGTDSGIASASDAAPEATRADAAMPRLGAVAVVLDPDIADLVPDFLDSRGRDVVLLREQLAWEDFAAIRTVGHNLKGSGLAYGFARLSEIGAEIESAAGRKDGAVIAACTDSLEQYLGQITWTVGETAPG